MIVADTNILAYFVFETQYTGLVTKVFEKDSTWAAPLVWRSELKNVLWKTISCGDCTLSDAVSKFNLVKDLIADLEYMSSVDLVLKTALRYNIATYDAEFVCIAKELGCKVVSYDKKLIKNCPDLVLSPEVFLAS